jgi:putative transposase
VADAVPEQAVDLDAVLGEERATSASDAAAGLDAVDEQLTARLAGRARESGLQLAGEGGLLGQLTSGWSSPRSRASSATISGYDRHDAAGRDGGNCRNGHRTKTFSADIHEAFSAWVSCAFWPARKTSTRGPA